VPTAVFVSYPSGPDSSHPDPEYLLPYRLNSQEMESSASQLADPLEAVLIEAGFSSLKEQFKREKVRICIHSKIICIE